MELRNPNQKYDVLLIGSSHMGSIQTCELWRRYGIAAYNEFHDGTSMIRTRASIELALQYVKPKVIVIDCEHWWDEWSQAEYPGSFHHTLDVFPTTLTKLKVINNLADTVEFRNELYYPFMIFHTRWKNLTESDYKIQHDYFIGSKPRLHIYDASELEEIIPAYDMDTSYDASYLEEVIQYCKSQGIDVMLTCLPYGASVNAQRIQNAIYPIAEKYGVLYLNFLNDPDIIDYQSDYNDGGHLNIEGARKCSDVIAQHLINDYGIHDRRNDIEYANIWQKNIENYIPALFEYTSKDGNASAAMLLFNVDGYYGKIIINDYMLLYNEAIFKMLENIIKKYDNQEIPNMSVVYQAMSETSSFVLVKDINGTIQQYAGSSALDFKNSFVEEMSSDGDCFDTDFPGIISVDIVGHDATPIIKILEDDEFTSKE